MEWKCFLKNWNKERKFKDEKNKRKRKLFNMSGGILFEKNWQVNHLTTFESSLFTSERANSKFNIFPYLCG